LLYYLLIPNSNVTGTST